MTHNSDTVQDVRLYTHGTNKVMLEYGTSLSTLKKNCKASGMRITHTSREEDGKLGVYVAARYKGVDPYTGEETYAGYRPSNRSKST
jgi:hypothetical protein